MQTQKIISLCGWEPRWLPNIQDCEEHSAKDGCSFGPAKAHANLSSDAGPSTKAHSASTKNRNGRKSHSRSPLLDCILCGSSVRVLDFLTVPRPVNPVDAPDTSKKLRGGSAASGVSGWVANDDLERENVEIIETTSERKYLSEVDLNLTIAGGFSSTHDDLTVQPTTSFESHNPTRKRSPMLDEGAVVDQKRPRTASSGAGPSRIASRISSSVIAMDTVSRSDVDSMESVENVPGDIDEASTYLENDVSELNNSAQAVGEASTNAGGGSVGMSAMSGESGAVERSRSVERGDSNWKEIESVESGEKGSRDDVDPSLSCNARLISDDKAAKSSSINHFPFDESETANNIGICL